MLKKFLWAIILEGSTIGSFFLGNIIPFFNIIFYILFWGQIACILTWFLIGCYNVFSSDVLKRRIYIIYKKCHMVLFKLPMVFLYLNNHKLIRKQFIFTDSCKYDIPEQGVNKLFGISFGMHHINSVRFGWKNKNTDKVEIYSYLYIDGVKQEEQKMCEVNINQLYTYHMEYYIANRSNHIATLWVRANTDIAQGNPNYEKFSYTLPNNLPKWGYSLFPYFGGQFKAPHKIKIKEIFY